MIKIKRIISVCVAACLVILMATTIRSHSGRTDSSGGHWDSSTGEYHYHHGYTAHDHYDMDGDGDIDCPYDFVVQESNSGVSSGSSSTSTIVSEPKQTEDDPVDEVPDQTPAVTEEPKPDRTFSRRQKREIIILVGILMLIVIIPICFYKRESRIQEERRIAEQKRIEKEVTDRINLRRQRSTQSIFMNMLRSEYNSLCTLQSLLIEKRKSAVHTPEELVQIPENTLMDSEGYPFEADVPKGNADRYTFSLSDTGVYHKFSCRYASSQKTNAVKLALLTSERHRYTRSIRPCLICKPVLPDLSWYPRYQTVLSDIKYINSVTNTKFSEKKTGIGKNSPYSELEAFISENNVHKTELLAKKMLHWFDQKTVRKLLRLSSFQNAEDSVFIASLKLLDENYDRWNAQLISERIAQRNQNTKRDAERVVVCIPNHANIDRTYNSYKDGVTADVPSQVASDPVTPEYVSPGYFKCPVCGKVQRSGRNLCWECGSVIAPSDTAEDQNSGSLN